MTKEERKADVLEAVIHWTHNQGYPPTYRELATHVGVAHSHIFGLVKELRADGLINGNAQGRSRTITLTDEGQAAAQQ
jgi:Mn-dependent DtxR family transcriptional regulator